MMGPSREDRNTYTHTQTHKVEEKFKSKAEKFMIGDPIDKESKAENVLIQ